MRIADRIVLMRAGPHRAAGTAEELYRGPADLFAARFFCDFNEVEGVGRGRRGSRRRSGCLPRRRLADGAGASSASGRRACGSSAAGFCLPGRVVSRRFLGEVDLVHVAVQGLDRPLQARRARRSRPAKGEDVGVEIDPDEVLVFAAGRRLGWRQKFPATPRRRPIGAGGLPWVAQAFGIGSSSASSSCCCSGAARSPSMMGDVAKGIKAFKKGMSDEDATPATTPVAAAEPNRCARSSIRRRRRRRERDRRPVATARSADRRACEAVARGTR